MSDFAKFNATLAKVNFNGKKTVVTLELDNRTAAQNIDFLMTNIDEAVIVNLGDPQMKMDFDEPHQGVKVTTDASGVVQSVEGEQEEMELSYEPVDEEGVEEEQSDLIDDDMDFSDDNEEHGAA